MTGLRPPTRDRARASRQAWRRWYFTARWQRLREAVKDRDDYTCGMCGAVCTGKGMATADHRIPHHGDPAMFWDPANIWCVCKPCHDGAKQREERGGRIRAVGADGYPLGEV